MYTVTHTFTVRRGSLECKVRGAPRTISQGSWVPEGTTIETLTDQELEWYGPYLDGDVVEEPEAVEPEDEDDA
jgi:hypothetical protein